MKRIFALAIALSTALSLGGCATVNFSGSYGSVSGAGDIITVEYPCGDFTGLEVELVAGLVYTADNSHSVKIEMYENLEEYIDVTNQNGVLLINSTAGITATNPDKMPLIYVSAPALEYLNLSGMLETLHFDEITADKFELYITGMVSCTFTLNVKELEVNLEGTSDVVLLGAAEKASLYIDGIGSLEAFGLVVKEAKATVDGVGSIEISCSDKLDAEVSGMGSVKYRGNPAVSKQIDGLGKILKVD